MVPMVPFKETTGHGQGVFPWEATHWVGGRAQPLNCVFSKITHVATGIMAKDGLGTEFLTTQIIAMKILRTLFSHIISFSFFEGIETFHGFH